MEAVKSFFCDSEFLKNHKDRLKILSVSLFATTFVDDSERPRLSQLFKNSRDKMLEFYKKAVVAGQYNELTFEKELFADIVKAIHFRDKVPLEGHFSVVGQCVPGTRRLFVSAGGNYYMCEKVGEHYSFGNVDTGLDFERIFDFMVQITD